MGFFRDILAFFKKRQRESTRNQFFSSQIDELFDYLSTYISTSNQAHATSVYIKNYLRLGDNERKQKLPESYLFVEKYLTDIDTGFGLSKEELRGLVKVKFASLLSIIDFALIFEEEDRQEFELCKLFLREVVSGLSDLLGESGSKKIQEIKHYIESVPNAFTGKNPLNDENFHPSGYNDWIQFLRKLSFFTFNILKEKLGEEAALRRYDKGYKSLAAKYINLDSFQIIISILPEVLMDEDRIGTLTKHQIEKLLLKRADHFEQLTKELQEKNEELERTQKLLIEAKDKAEEATKTKAMFLANMSHEIRTPMNAVIGMTEILKDTDPSKEQLLYIDTIYKSGYDLIHIINDILDYSKIESGKLELEQKEINIHDFTSDVTNLLVLRAEEKNIDLIYYVDEAIPSCVLADPVRLKQVLVNLIGNAIKFTNVGEVVLEVLLKEKTDRTLDIEFNIKDSGIGIPKNKVKHIFDSFSQVDTSTTRNYGGTGLGLTITKSLVQMMNGNISVRSKVDEGSTFTFTINVPYKEDEPVNKKLKAFDKKTILLADQNETHKNILAKKLKSWGVEVHTFSTAEELLANYKKAGSVDVIMVEDFLLNKTDSSFKEVFFNLLTSKKIPLVRVVPFGYQPNEFSSNMGQVINRPIRRATLIDTIYDALTDVKTIEKVTAPKPLHTPKKISILVAEDNSTNQVVMKKMMSKIGYEIEIAETGEEVIQKLSSKFYELIFMDVQMPILDGLQATQKIRLGVYEKGQPTIIAMTANASEEDKQMCLFVGMNDYLSKPVTRNDIISKIEKWFPEE
ncbi:MAG: response regulator [Balneola sp.]|nr:MAG: response regulator [Balneola sp.]